MNHFLISLPLMLAFNLSYGSNWEVVEEEKKTIKDPHEILKVLDRKNDKSHVVMALNSVFHDVVTKRSYVDLPKRIMSELDFKVKKLKWNGPNNSCKDDDPRQYEYTHNCTGKFSPGGLHVWFFKTIMTPDDWDPCAEGAEIPKIELKKGFGKNPMETKDK